MKKSDLDSIKRGMAQAQAFLRGDREGFVVHEPVNVKGIRAQTKLTREKFAAKYGLDKRTLEQWEQGRRRPDRSTETYLRLIESKPEEVAAMVSELAS